MMDIDKAWEEFQHLENEDGKGKYIMYSQLFADILTTDTATPCAQDSYRGITTPRVQDFYRRISAIKTREQFEVEVAKMKFEVLS